MKVLVTGGCGFIGSNFLNLFVPRYPQYSFLNLDSLSYAANPHNLEKLEAAENYRFGRVDLGDSAATAEAVSEFQPDAVIHFAAESHVDRSIRGPEPFVRSNVLGTFNLLEACRSIWSDTAGKVFHHVSTDEVFGELGPEGQFSEETSYDPSSPYSASKAASDHFVRAWGRTFGLPIKITNCSNNYGPYQFPEKLIPLMVHNAMAGRPLPVYGDGSNVRDWLFVDDHCEAIWQVVEHGRLGQTYCIGGDSERTNLEVVHAVCRSVAKHTGRPEHELLAQIEFVTDRPGHDHRYAIDATKIKRELGWKPTVTFEDGLDRTVKWYISNQEWVNNVVSGEYRNWVDEHYGRLANGS